MGAGRVVEPRRELRREAIEHGSRGTRFAGGGHHAGPKLPDRLLPRLRIGGNIGRAQGIERQTTGPILGVMAFDAILV